MEERNNKIKLLRINDFCNNTRMIIWMNKKRKGMIGKSKETKNQKEGSEQSPRNRKLKKTG